jgi:hypothetical protein
MPVFRGGGGPTSKERGWYAVLVCILRFVDMRGEGVEEKGRRRGVVAGEAANLKTKLTGAVKGTNKRCADMMKDVEMVSPV